MKYLEKFPKDKKIEFISGKKIIESPYFKEKENKVQCKFFLYESVLPEDE